MIDIPLSRLKLASSVLTDTTVAFPQPTQRKTQPIGPGTGTKAGTQIDPSLADLVFIERRLTEDGWQAPDGDVYVNHWLPVWDLDDCGPVAERLAALVVDALDHQAADVLDEVRSR
jgi:hypothetical protein